MGAAISIATVVVLVSTALLYFRCTVADVI
jgi:hypothetical protein